MALDRSGQWWKGTDPSDIHEYLDELAAYPLDEYRQPVCSCGAVAFGVQYDENEGGAQRCCSACGASALIGDSADYWPEAEPETLRCECGSLEFNIGVGFSLYEPKGDVRWPYVGVRCALCGILGCCAEWKVAYGPSCHLVDQV